jgi:hypothetical protein
MRAWRCGVCRAVTCAGVVARQVTNLDCSSATHVLSSIEACEPVFAAVGDVMRSNPVSMWNSSVCQLIEAYTMSLPSTCLCPPEPDQLPLPPTVDVRLEHIATVSSSCPVNLSQCVCRTQCSVHDVA